MPDSQPIETTDFVATLFDGESNPDKATVAFTMALKALEKGHSATVILMAAAVHLGQPDAATGLDIGEPFRPLPDLMKDYLESGGRVVVCGACMKHNELAADQMDSRFAVIDAGGVIDLVMTARGGLQIT